MMMVHYYFIIMIWFKFNMVSSQAQYYQRLLNTVSFLKVTFKHTM